MKSERDKMILKLDTLVSKIVIFRDNKCVQCGRRDRLTAGHVFSRRHLATRWDLKNVYCQCIGCNLKHVRDQYPYFKWYEENVGPLEPLRNKHEKTTNYKQKDLEDMYEALVQVCKQVGVI